MDPTDLPGPQPAEIERFSPSTANLLLSCRLRLAFARDPGHSRHRRPSTFSSLGVIAHSVTEAAFKRSGWPEREADVRTMLEAIWDEESIRAEELMAEAWNPAEPPPVIEWPGYALTRARTLRRAAAVAGGRTGPSAQEPSPGAGVEVDLSDDESGLFGRADRIERDGKGMRVVDLKTGLNQDEPTEAQRRQLLLYAVLLHRATGTWPASIAVEDASGNLYDQRLEPAEAEEALRSVQAAVGEFNRSVRDGHVLDGADPGPDTCRWCDFRTVCQPYWQHISAEWGHRAARGRVTSSGSSDDGWYVELEIDQPVDRAGTILHLAGLPSGVLPGASTIAVVNWVGPPEASVVRARWSTRTEAQ